MTDATDKIEEAEDVSWHLDRKVPVAIIVTIVGQLIGFGWIASKLDSRIEVVERFQTSTTASKFDTRVDMLERSGTRHERAIELLTEGRDLLKERLVRLEESQRHSVSILERIERSVVKK